MSRNPALISLRCRKSVTGQPRDPPLAALGETQAKEVAAYFLSLPESERPTAIFSSPYYRCLQTALPTAQALNIPIYIEHGLSEWYSPVKPNTGLHPRPGPASSATQFFPAGAIDPEGWTSIHYPSRKGESIAQIHDRVEQFLEDFIPLRPDGERVLLVSHAGTIAAAVGVLSNDRDMPVRIGCCSLSEFVPKAEKGWTALKIADGAHMAGGSQREWGFMDVEVDKGQVVHDTGEPGTEDEVDEPVGSQIRNSAKQSSNL